MDMEIKEKLLDQLMGEMEDHQASMYQKPKLVAVTEEVKVAPTPEENPKGPLKKAMGLDPDAEEKVYMNPDREKVLEEVEKESASADEMPKGAWASFVRAKKG